jgi:poly(hydroxyalkanoate) granule-associated protein
MTWPRHSDLRFAAVQQIRRSEIIEFDETAAVSSAKGVVMAASRKRGTSESTARRKREQTLTPAGSLIENLQQVWLAGMGTIAKAQKGGPAALQDAVAQGLALLGQSRSGAGKRIRDVVETAQESVEARLGSARDHATETWENLEALFQSRMQKALQQIGVPSAEEVRLLTRRVAELNASVKALSAKQTGRVPRTRARTRRRTTRTAS